MEIHATLMPRRVIPKANGTGMIHVNPDNAEPQRHSSLARMQDQLVQGQTDMEIHAMAMPHPEGVTPRASSTGRASQNTPAAQFTEKGGGGLLVRSL